MANNRYYLQCPVCKDRHYIGKSLGDGIYNTRAYEGQTVEIADLSQMNRLSELGKPVRDLKEAAAEFLEEMYQWMWKHLMDCHRRESMRGEIFSVVTAYPAERERCSHTTNWPNWPKA